MKREIAAALLLAAIFIGALINIACFERLSSRLSDEVELSLKAAEAGDFETAEKKLEDALSLWLSADGYTHIFIRHSEIDAVSDTFYELLDAAGKGDSAAYSAVCRKLLYHIDSVRRMERISVGSVM